LLPAPHFLSLNILGPSVQDIFDGLRCFLPSIMYTFPYSTLSFRVCSFEDNDLRKSEMIDLREFEDEVYAVLFKEFEDDNGVVLRV